MFLIRIIIMEGKHDSEMTAESASGAFGFFLLLVFFGLRRGGAVDGRLLILLGGLWIDCTSFFLTR